MAPFSQKQVHTASGPGRVEAQLRVRIEHQDPQQPPGRTVPPRWAAERRRGDLTKAHVLIRKVEAGSPEFPETFPGLRVPVAALSFR
jgi:hypothetical protein